MLHDTPDLSRARLAARTIPGIARSCTTGGTSMEKPNQSRPLGD